MPKLVTGYHTAPDGTVTEHEMYVGELNDACIKFPKEWSKTGKGSVAKAVKKFKKPFKKFAKPEKSATSPFPPAPPPTGAEDDQ